MPVTRPHPHLPLLLLAILAGVVPALPAHATGDGSLQLEVLVDGVPLRELHARGTTYVEALRGREYAVRLTNLEPVRVAVALAVDGRNTIDGARGSARGGRKWILDPGQTVTLHGWQSGQDVAHRFVFATEETSHAAWLGDASGAGAIEAVAFRERRPQPEPLTWIPWIEDQEVAGRRGDRLESARQAQGGAPASGPAAAAPSPSLAKAAGKVRESELGAARQERDARVQKDDSDGPAATGFGRALEHRVTRIRFDAESEPSATVRLRYEYRDALVRLGVLPRARPLDVLARREVARGFTD